MSRSVHIVGDPGVPGRAWLRTVDTSDQESLRAWRNAAAVAFFEQSPIDPAGQCRWFEGYLGRDEDFLFLVMEGTAACGCLGVRLVAGEWDVYNVIRGVRTPGSQGFMGSGLGMLVDFARRRAGLPVRAVVLAANPAIAWYERNAFRIAMRQEGSLVMRWTEELVV